MSTKERPRLTDPSDFRPPIAPAGAVETARADAAALWQGGWALGVTAGAAAMLVLLGAMSLATATALAMGALPGVLGYLWRPRGLGRLALLTVWAIGAGLAVTISGGATGPLAAWCVAPVLAGALL